ETPLHKHAAALKALGGVEWFADPAGATEIEEFRAAGLRVRPAQNAIRPGIAAVSARLQTGRLRVVRGACEHLVREAGLYRYPGAAGRGGEGGNPVEEHNHAPAAVRDLVAGVGARVR